MAGQHPHEVRPEIGRYLTETFFDLVSVPVPDNVIFLKHHWFNVNEIAGLIDLAVLWNGTSAVEFATLGTPVLMASWFGPLDYPVGFRLPRDREDYETLVATPNAVAAGAELAVRAQALLAYMASDEVSVPYRYTARPATNIDIHPAFQWIEEDIRRWQQQADENVRRIADAIIAEVEGRELPEFMRRHLAGRPAEMD